MAGYKEVIGFACGEWIDEVFIPPCDENQYPDELVSAFMEMGITVHTGIMKSGILPSGCQQVEKIGDYTVITTSMNYADSSKLTVKRMMDIAGGLAGCLITLLILIIVGPVIYINSLVRFSSPRKESDETAENSGCTNSEVCTWTQNPEKRTHVSE